MHCITLEDWPQADLRHYLHRDQECVVIHLGTEDMTLEDFDG